MSCEDVRAAEWRENRGCDFSEAFLKLGERIFHPSNKQRLKLISCLGYEAFPFFKLQSIQQPPRSMRQRSGGSVCGYVMRRSGKRLKSWNEAQGNDKWGQRHISSYLAWLACKLVWCADHLALYPGGKKKDELIDDTTVLKTFILLTCFQNSWNFTWLSSGGEKSTFLGLIKLV